MKEHKNKIQKYFIENPSQTDGGVDQKAIEFAESELNLVFSRAYIDYLLTYGSGGAESFYIYGLRNKSISVIDNTLHYRNQNWPGTEDWYIVSDDGSGNPFGVDPDGKVWLSDHDSGEIIKVADDFVEFLYKIITDTLWDDIEA